MCGLSSSWCNQVWFELITMEWGGAQGDHHDGNGRLANLEVRSFVGSENRRCLSTCAWTHASTPHGPPCEWGRRLWKNISLEGDLQRSVKSVGTQWCSVFTPVAMFRQTLCCMRPYSRSGKSQKKKFCFFHSALKEGPLAEPNISSRKACDKINRYAIIIIGREGGRDSHKACYNMLLDHT